MGYWLIKSEPGTWSWEQHVKKGVDAWTGVRNHQAKTHLKAMRKGDRAFFYHSGDGREIVGLSERALAPVAIDATTRAQMEALGYVVPAPSAAAAGGGEHPRDMLPNVALFTEALGAFNQREFEAAERYARAALERMPNSARAHELLSRLAVIAGRPRDGLPHALEAARLNPFHADYVAAVGSIQLQLGDLAAAARSFEEAVRLDPDDAAYRVGLVWKVKVGGSLQDAEAHAARAIELSPGDPAQAASFAGRAASVSHDGEAISRPA